MGFFSDEDQASVSWQLDALRFRPGDTITGHVVINLLKSIRFSQVNVGFKGLATSYVTKTRSVSYTSNGKIYYRIEEYKVNQEEILCREKVPAIMATHMVEKLHIGQHVIPFSFRVPIGLPDTFKDCQKKEGAEIQYRLKVEIVIPAMLKSNLVYYQNVLVQTPYGGAGSKPQSAHRSDDPITQMCCFGAGSLTWTAHLDSDISFPGQTFTANVDLDCSALSKNMQAKVKAYVLRSTNVYCQGNNQVLTKTISETSTPVLLIKGVNENRVGPLSLKIPQEGSEGSVFPTSGYSPIHRCYYEVWVEVECGWMATLRSKMNVELFAVDGRQGHVLQTPMDPGVPFNNLIDVPGTPVEMLLKAQTPPPPEMMTGFATPPPQAYQQQLYMQQQPMNSQPYMEQHPSSPVQLANPVYDQQQYAPHHKPYKN